VLLMWCNCINNGGWECGGGLGGDDDCDAEFLLGR
jgi:hypothetical protein